MVESEILKTNARGMRKKNETVGASLQLYQAWIHHVSISSQRFVKHFVCFKMSRSLAVRQHEFYKCNISTKYFKKLHLNESSSLELPITMRHDYCTHEKTVSQFHCSKCLILFLNFKPCSFYERLNLPCRTKRPHVKASPLMKSDSLKKRQNDGLL